MTTQPHLRQTMKPASAVIEWLPDSDPVIRQCIFDIPPWGKPEHMVRMEEQNDEDRKEHGLSLV